MAHTKEKEVLAKHVGMADRIYCPVHPHAPLVEDWRAGDQICTECGLVVGDRVIDVGAEWRTFKRDTETVDRSRVGGRENPLLHGSDLTTWIGQGTGPVAYIEDDIPKYRYRLSLLSPIDRLLTAGYREIREMSDRLSLPLVIQDRANGNFKLVIDSKIIGTGLNGAGASACLFIACRQEKVPRTFKEICAVSRVSRRLIGRAFKVILQGLGTSVELITTTDFMSRFCSTLGLPIGVQKCASAVAKAGVELGLVPGSSPISIAAAAIYMASQVSKLQRSPQEVGEVAGVAAVTIRHTYKLLLPRALDLFPKDFLFVTPIEDLPK